MMSEASLGYAVTACFNNDVWMNANSAMGPPTLC